MSGALVTVGYASLDRSGLIAHFQGVDATSIVLRSPHAGVPGVGGVAHIARAAAVAGAGTAVVSWVGPDEDGRRWTDALSDDGCLIEGVAVGGIRSPGSTMIDVASGGTICLFDPGDCHPDVLTDAQRRVLADAAVVVLTVAPAPLTAAVLDALPETALLVWAVKHDDAVYDAELRARVLRRADVVSHSRGENDWVFRDASARPGALVIETRGAEGVAWRIAGAPQRGGSARVDAIGGVDTTGAGDTFVGTLSAGLGGARPASLDDTTVAALLARSSAAVADLLRARCAAPLSATPKENH